MKQIQIIFKQNEDPEKIKTLEVRFPNQKNRLWIKARYFYFLKYVVGFEVEYK